MKKLFFLFLIVLFSNEGYSQLRMVENFDYPFGDTNTIASYGWTVFSSTFNPIKIAGSGLNYAGYAYSGVGNSVQMDSTGQDAFRSFYPNIDSINSSTAYLSCLINVSKAKLGAYVITLCDSGSTTNFRGRLYVKDSVGNVRFGIAKSAASDTAAVNVWSPNDYSYNTTYLVVVKYKWNSGIANDEVSLFVFPSGVPATEPVTPTLGPLTYPSSDAGKIGRVVIRQGESTRGSTCRIDGIRVSNKWIGPYMTFGFGIQGLASAPTSRIDTARIFLRNSTSPYAIVDGFAQSVNFTNGLTSYPYEFDAAPGSYYFEVRFRNDALYRNGINTWSQTGSSFANGTTYDFTTAANKAFGDNQIQVGSAFTMYNGDVTQDGTVDLSDIVMVFNDAGAFATGYLATDIDGNDFVDLSDITVAFNNSTNFVSEIAP